MNTTEVGEEIREKRKVMGLRAYQLAQKLGVSAVYITQMEKSGKMPSPELFRKLYHYLGLSKESLEGYIQSRVIGLGFKVGIKE